MVWAAYSNPQIAHRTPARRSGLSGSRWVRVALFGDAVAALAPRLTKGSEVYCEGHLALGTWTGLNGEARAGLNLAA